MHTYIYTEGKVRAKGRRDGRAWRWACWPFWKNRDKASYPTVDDTNPAQYEQELFRAMSTDIRNISQQWSAEDRKLKSDCGNARAEHEEARRTAAAEGKDLSPVQKALVEAEGDFLAMPKPSLSPLAGYPLLAVILVSEMYFNYKVFQLFGQSSRETWAMTIGILVAFMALPHLAGKALRKDEKTVVDKLFMIGSVVIGMAGFAAISIIREKYLEANQVVELLGIQWSANNITMLLMAFNVVMFFAVAWLSYELGHRAPEDYQKKKDRYLQAQRNAKKEGSEATTADARLLRATTEFNRAHTSRTKRFEELRGKVEHCRENYLWYIQVYRTANMEERPAGGTPGAFKTQWGQAVEIPETLRVLEGCQECSYRSTVEAYTENPVEGNEPAEPRGERKA